jgi:hypothetical protein
MVVHCIGVLPWFEIMYTCTSWYVHVYYGILMTLVLVPWYQYYCNRVCPGTQRFVDQGHHRDWQLRPTPRSPWYHGTIMYVYHLVHNYHHGSYHGWLAGTDGTTWQYHWYTYTYLVPWYQWYVPMVPGYHLGYQVHVHHWQVCVLYQGTKWYHNGN